MDEYLRWPFFEHRHHELARDLRGWAESELVTRGADPSLTLGMTRAAPSPQSSRASTASEGSAPSAQSPGRSSLASAASEGSAPSAQSPGRSSRASAASEGSAPPSAPSVDTQCRSLAAKLGERGWLKYCIPATHGGAHDPLDVRSLCLCRETLAEFDPLADFVFAMQGLGAGPISLYGTDAQKSQYLPGVGRGETIAAFALSEADAGSDVAAMQTTARRTGTGWVLDGEKTFISNAGIADFYVVFARMPEEGERSFGAFVVDARTPGLTVTARIETLSPHPLGSINLTSVQAGSDRLIGNPGKGLRVALGTLDVFRSTVAAAALGFARRALLEAVAHARTRRLFDKALSEHQITQAKIAEMALSIDASALLVYRAAWTRDTQKERVTREAAMAKLFATEAAQRVIDDAVQLLGGRGVVAGAPVERLYREIRALRIYEGTSEVQRLIIAGEMLGA